MGKYYCMAWFQCLIFSTLLTLESVPDILRPVNSIISSRFYCADKNQGACLRRSITIFQKLHSPRTAFNSKTELDTILDKTYFKGYWQFISVYSHSCNSLQTLKIWPDFQSFPFNFFQIATVGLLRQSNEGSARLPRASEHLVCNFFTQLLSTQLMGLLGPKYI